MPRPVAKRRWVFLVAPLGAATVIACGPFFPENALDAPRRILQPPLFHFHSELNRLPLPDTLSKHKPGSPAYTLDLEMAEMEEMMAAYPDRESWLSRYRSLRQAMIHAGDASNQKMRQADADAAPSWEKAKRDLDAIITPLPEDVRLYLKAAALHLDGLDATGLWKQVLALPAEKRLWRGTWAAWMLFRTSPHDEQGHWLSETRRLSREGGKDCLHLGIEATYILGRQGSDYAERSTVSAAEWKRAAMLRAMLGLSRATDTLRQDRRLFAEWSESFAREVIADPFLRRVQMLQLIEMAADSRGWESGHVQPRSESFSLTPWLESFEKAGIRDQREAVLLAWTTYNAAKFSEARRWLSLAPADDVNALALRGKLAAMRGDRRETERHFKQIAQSLPTPEKSARVAWRRAQSDEWFPLTTQNYDAVRQHLLLADYGVAQVARNDFAGALQTFLRTDYWLDAAYIAERLLSVEELLTLSRSGRLPKLEKLHVPDDASAGGPLRVSRLEAKYYGSWSAENAPEPFTYLVARRLAREGFIKDACKLLPDDLAIALRRYSDEVQRSKNTRLSREQRANALWMAAQLQRQLGMELFGFETGPDHAWCSGSFDLGSFATDRGRKFWHSEWETLDRVRHTPVFPATSDELWRAKHYGPLIERRFHYRHTAADLAWRAAALMPDDDEETAKVLAIAGSWLKTREPKDADRFYKALVLRNPSVPLAQDADHRRWFPPVQWTFDLDLE